MSVQTIDLTETFGPARNLTDDDARVKERIDRIMSYIKADGVPSPSSLLKMAKIGIVIDDWMQSLDNYGWCDYVSARHVYYPRDLNKVSKHLVLNR